MRRGQITSWDALIAVLLVVAIMTFTFLAFYTVMDRQLAALRNFEKQREVMTYADWLVKDGLAYQKDDSPLSHHHIIDLSNLQKLQTDFYIAVNDLDSNELDHSGTIPEGERFCINRLVVVKGQRNPDGILQVCA